MHNNQKGIISHIQSMSLHDGEGIRTTLFLKGCDLHCQWCHNPETFSPRPQLEWIQTKCLHCGLCLESCPTHALSVVRDAIVRDQSLCIQCHACVSSCYSQAHNLIGKAYTVEEICELVESDRTVFELSNGGVTISGGEPMMQFDFLLALVQQLHTRGINICIQTNLNSRWEKYEQILLYINYMMCDLKHIDPEAHKHWTGHDNRRILDNIRHLDQSGCAYCLRTPVVPGVNDSEETLSRMSAFVSELKHIRKYELLPFHPLASYKYKDLGMNYPFEEVAQTPKEQFAEMKKRYER